MSAKDAGMAPGVLAVGRASVDAARCIDIARMRQEGAGRHQEDAAMRLQRGVTTNQGDSNMNRILDLQKLDESMDDLMEEAGISTSSNRHCDCSTSSGSSCNTCPIIISI
jgi:hypothetical protein